MTDKIKIGSLGENLAADFLVAKGYQIVARNYRYKHSEIDIIARFQNVLVFVEVKTRTSTQFGEPELSVNNRKTKKISEGLNQYVIDANWNGPIRFDIISIVVRNEESEIVHLEDATF